MEVLLENVQSILLSNQLRSAKLMVWVKTVHISPTPCQNYVIFIFLVFENSIKYYNKLNNYDNLKLKLCLENF